MGRVKNTAPIPQDLRDALVHPSVAAHATLPLDRLHVAVHLALPTEVALGIQARLLGTQLDWRGSITALPLPGDEPTPAFAAALLECLAPLYLPGDRFLDLGNDEPLTWVKDVPSGARTLVVGPDILFGLPRLALEVGVNDEERLAILTHLHTARLAPAGLVQVASRVLTVLGNQESVIVTSTPPPPRRAPEPATKEQVDHLGRYLGEVFAASLKETIELPDPDIQVAHVEYLYELPNSDLELLVSAHVDSTGSAAIGYPGTWMPARHEVPGFEIDGASVHEPGWVARHVESDLRVLLRRRSL